MLRLEMLMFTALSVAIIVPTQAVGMQCPSAVRGNLDAVGEGRRAYLEFNCVSCHGNAAGGGMGPKIKGAEQGDVSEAVLRGDAKEGGMPSFKGCATPTDVENIVAYLRSIGTKSEPTWLDWWKANP